MRLAGVIICGGRSTRMGVSKATLRVGGETLVQRMVRLIAPQVSGVIVSTARGQELGGLPASVIRVEDRQADRGPIEGLYQGLAAAEQSGREAAFVSAVDLPCLAPALIPRLAGRLPGGADATIPVHDGFRQPLAGLYRTHVRKTVEAAIEEGAFALQTLLDRLHIRELQPEAYADIDPEGRSFRNINTPEDYEQLLALLGNDGSLA
jgi:molybdenum cofactor guanylyltransferase